MESVYIDARGEQDYLDLIAKLEAELKQVVEEKAYSYQEDTNAWHDNFAYEDASRKELELISRISEMKAYIGRAKLIESRNEKDIADIGATIVIETDEELVIKLIGGPTNLDSEIMEVSINSPMGKAIYGKKVGESFSYQVEEIEHIGKIKRIND